MIVEAGSGTLNDANVSDTVVPLTLPSVLNVIFDITAIIVNLDDFILDVRIGAAASERIVFWNQITSDGVDIFIDPGNGVSVLTELRRVGIHGFKVGVGEQVLFNYTKNSANSRDIPYEWMLGI